MAKIHGKNAHIEFDGVDLETTSNQITISDSVDEEEVTGFNPPGNAKEFVAGLRDITGSLNGYWDTEQDATTATGVLEAALVSGEAESLVVGPAGSGDGSIRYTYDCTVLSYDKDISNSGAVTISANLRLSNPAIDSFPA